MNKTNTLIAAVGAFALLGCGYENQIDQMAPIPAKRARTPFDDLEMHSPIHFAGGWLKDAPSGITPSMARKAYKLPSSGGAGNTIAVIIAYDMPDLESDLNVFSSTFGLPECTTSNGCFEKYKIDPMTSVHYGWGFEAALDIQWAHAIAPDAKILLVLAKTNLNTDLLAAVDYARKRADVVAVSMSWGGGEMVFEKDYESYFTSDHDVVFFAASGDGGTGVLWPSVSANVVSVGGTELEILIDGTVLGEKTWRWSGGGFSRFVDMPDYQKDFGLNYRRPEYQTGWSNSPMETDQTVTFEKKQWRRATPDVSYHADTTPGFATYVTLQTGEKGWAEAGGTSAGTPQWAAIHAIGLSVSLKNLYSRGASVDRDSYFRDITLGHNGYCGWLCKARRGYDYATGLGSPITVDFK